LGPLFFCSSSRINTDASSSSAYSTFRIHFVFFYYFLFDALLQNRKLVKKIRIPFPSGRRRRRRRCRHAFAADSNTSFFGGK
jgi:predicted PurR-regulated permease PerM